MHDQDRVEHGGLVQQREAAAAEGLDQGGGFVPRVVLMPGGRRQQ